MAQDDCSQVAGRHGKISQVHKLNQGLVTAGPQQVTSLSRFGAGFAGITRIASRRLSGLLLSSLSSTVYSSIQVCAGVSSQNRADVCALFCINKKREECVFLLVVKFLQFSFSTCFSLTRPQFARLACTSCRSPLAVLQQRTPL